MIIFLYFEINNLKKSQNIVYIMPKNNIDYSNTVIYKIFCKDKSITDVYIGHTTNLTKRKYQHKLKCENGDNLKIYKIITDNGGWNNWDMIELEKFNCKDLNEAKIKEQEYYEKFNSTLNSCPPYVDKKNYYCEVCKTQCETNFDYKIHIETNKHIANLSPKVTKKYHCELCDYNTCKIRDFKKHLQTLKHENRENETPLTDLSLKVPKNLQCICGISFYNRITLWRHKKKCNFENKINEDINEEDNSLSDKDLIIMLVKQNTELMDMLIKNKYYTQANHNKTLNNNNTE